MVISRQFSYFRYTTAIKMYRMALDQIPANMESIRCKITRNIGHAFFAMRQFPDAAESYENLLIHDGTPQIGINVEFGANTHPRLELSENHGRAEGSDPSGIGFHHLLDLIHTWFLRCS